MRKLKLNFMEVGENSSAGKRTARFLLAGACVSYVSCVHCISYVFTLLAFIALRALDRNPA